MSEEPAAPDRPAAYPKRARGNAAFAESFTWLKENSIAISACAGAISALIAGLALLQTTRLASNSDLTTRAGIRAYIAVTGARFDGVPEAGANQRINILYENVGVQPADDVSHVWDWSGGAFDITPDAKGMPYVSLQTTKWPRLETCPVLPEQFVNRRPVYPKVINEAPVFVFNTGPDFMPASVVDGRGSFFVFGCFVYRTLSAPRVSPYCLYLQPKRGRPITEAVFEWCPAGSGNPT